MSNNLKFAISKDPSDAYEEASEALRKVRALADLLWTAEVNSEPKCADGTLRVLADIIHDYAQAGEEALEIIDKDRRKKSQPIKAA